MSTKTKAEVGQWWRDKDSRMKGHFKRVVRVVSVGETHAEVVSLKDRRASRIKLDKDGGIRGYALVTGHTLVTGDGT